MASRRSSVVTEFEQAVAAQYNRIYSDVVLHNHVDGFGAQISHGDLGDGVIPGTYMAHAEIDVHIQGAGTSADPDAHGGYHGIHKLPSGVYVLGSLTDDTFMFIGEDTTDGWTSGVVNNQEKDVTYPFSLAATPYVCVIVNWTSDTVPNFDYHNSVRVAVSSPAGAGFTAEIGIPYNGDDCATVGQCNIPFSWFAIGVPA